MDVESQGNGAGFQYLSKGGLSIRYEFANSQLSNLLEKRNTNSSDVFTGRHVANILLLLACIRAFLQICHSGKMFKDFPCTCSGLQSAPNLPLISRPTRSRQTNESAHHHFGAILPSAACLMRRVTPSRSNITVRDYYKYCTCLPRNCR